MPDKENTFAGVSQRVKAVIIDSVMLIIFMVAITNIFELFESVPDTARIIAFVFIFFLYDPIFTSSFGGTIGHMIIGIRVKRESDIAKNIIFPLALIRFIAKATLGWISLLTVSSSKKSKAIHDSIIRSVVVEK